MFELPAGKSSDFRNLSVSAVGAGETTKLMMGSKKKQHPKLNTTTTMQQNLKPVTKKHPLDGKAILTSKPVSDHFENSWGTSYVLTISMFNKDEKKVQFQSRTYE